MPPEGGRRGGRGVLPRDRAAPVRVHPGGHGKVRPGGLGAGSGEGDHGAGSQVRPGASVEFAYSARETREDGRREVATITHVPTGADLAAAAGGRGPFNVTRVFGDGLFLGADEYVHLRVSGADDLKGFPQQYHLANGYFGEKEYAEVKIFNTMDRMRRNFDEQEFSMWHIRPAVSVPEESSDGGGGGADEHADWLVRKMHSMGIDYLERMVSDYHQSTAALAPPRRRPRLSEAGGQGALPTDLEAVPPRQAHEGRRAGEAGVPRADLRAAPGCLPEPQGSRREGEGAVQGAGRDGQPALRALAVRRGAIAVALDEARRGGGGAGEAEVETAAAGRYVLNTTASVGVPQDGGEGGGGEPSPKPSVQLWVIFLYSGRCGMSRTVVGSVDLAARQLATEGIKVGAYGCGLYPEHPPGPRDPTGVTSDPICAQFRRRETPNVHVVVETVPGRRRRADGTLEDVPLDPAELWENAAFRHFYSSAADGNTTHYYPHNFIGFARAGRRVWEDGHLVHRMGYDDFDGADFAGNVSVVAFLDGTDGDDGDGEESSSEVVGAVLSSLPGLARRFRSDDVYVGRAWCGYGDEFESVVPDDVDCSRLGVSRLPDIKLYAAGDAVGSSLLRGSFADARDVQIALESAGNVLRMMIGGEDTADEVDGIDYLDDDINGDMDGSCDGGMDQQPPPPTHEQQGLDEIEGRMEKDPQLEMPDDHDTVPQPPEEQKLERPRKPKLVDSADGGETLSGRETKNRLGGFHQRSTSRRGGGRCLVAEAAAAGDSSLAEPCISSSVKSSHS
ncbi:hypothetical protein THAOC_19041 [Thalassiosira oceanica]|uniref:Uncharacterized protein n=1 Tax=Thalassiosira oceanica TaxID=159749 RepID=K0S5M5_THAOC|nr:hypothetical protein THAOC_19041 [Thalassiosira oceanica]|eukprot:EJK60575.1 hypothetical protein THAOC_19041 [Thalassiosira oceanica]